jgi:ABC-2 type transport system permease protein
MNLKSDMNVVVDGGIMSYRALFAWLEPKTYLTSCILLPFFQILFFATLGRFSGDESTVHYVVVGNSIQIMSIAAIVGAVQTIAQERQEGTLQFVLGTPVNRVLMITGRMLLPIVDGMVKVFMGLTIGIVLFGLSIPAQYLPQLLVIVLITCFGMVGLGLMVGTLGLLFRDVSFLTNSFYFVLLVLCGVNFPIEKLPLAAQYVSKVIPLTYGTSSAREAIASGTVGWTAVSACIVLGCIYLAVSIVLFRTLEVVAKKYGTLEAF